MIPLVSQLPGNGFVCLNADDANVRSLAASVTEARVILYGQAKDADLRVENISATMATRLSFDLIAGEERRRVQTQFVGTLLLPSIVGALAVVRALELDLDQAIAQLARAHPLQTRMGIQQGSDGHTYVLDTYKSSFWSTQLLVKDMPNISEGSRVFIVNDVTNVGGDSSKRYRQLLRLASETCTTVIAMGAAANPAEVLVRNEPQRANVKIARSSAEVDAILGELPPSVVVIKGRAFKPNFGGLKANR
jgi:UDP-N-acetylmuramoyl-tripeptide--D-alanyl-D-alanine ligase